MAKTTAPILSFGAAGQIAKTQVYARWRGIPYARRYIIPANPRTAGQTLTRSTFTFLTQLWKLMATGAQAPWTAYATGQPLTNRNALLKFNVQALRSGSDLTDFVGSPGSGGGIPLVAASATGGAGSISTTVTAPQIPTGWTLTSVDGIAQLNADPHTATAYRTTFEQAVASPWEPAWTGLAAGSYIVSLWTVWTKPDGSTAYGPSINAPATVS
jgi:hypothetical protein